jgi:hypothetical protein
MQDAEDEPLFCERVAGLDIAKAGVEVTNRVPSDTTPGRRKQETRTFGTTRAELESPKRHYLAPSALPFTNTQPGHNVPVHGTKQHPHKRRYPVPARAIAPRPNRGRPVRWSRSRPSILMNSTPDRSTCMSSCPCWAAASAAASPYRLATSTVPSTLAQRAGSYEGLRCGSVSCGRRRSC